MAQFREIRKNYQIRRGSLEAVNPHRFIFGALLKVDLSIHYANRLPLANFRGYPSSVCINKIGGNILYYQYLCSYHTSPDSRWPVWVVFFISLVLCINQQGREYSFVMFVQKCGRFRRVSICEYQNQGKVYSGTYQYVIVYLLNSILRSIFLNKMKNVYIFI